LVTTYTVHEPAAPVSDRIDRGADLDFVKDGFSWLAAICPPAGFLANGLWLVAAAYLVVVTLAAWALTAAKVDPGWTGLLIAAANIYLGFELSTVKRWALERKGWTTLGVVNGSSIVDCERRFLESWLPGQPIIGGATTGQAVPSVPQVPRSSGFWTFGGRS
jgi:hypothetical protein